jgi:hypothetical protein
MATRTLRGTAAAVAQVSTVQVTAYDAATTYSLIVNGNSISVIAAGGVNQTATALAAAWNASTIPEFTGVTATPSTDTVTLTADVAGIPFTATSDDSGGTGTIGSVTAGTAASGQDWWSTANNWSAATVPTSSDIAIIDGGTSLRYGLDQSAVTLAELRIMRRFTGYIGLPKRNALGFAEYFDDYAKISATLLNIGVGNGTGSGRVKLNLGSVASAIVVDGTGNPIEKDVPACCLVGTSSSNALTVNGGSVGVGVFDETCSLAGGLTINGGAVYIGKNVTLGPITQNGGTLNVAGATMSSAALWIKK